MSNPLVLTMFDYGAGNLHSLEKALTVPGVVVRIESDPERAVGTDVLVLPGVGGFGAAAAQLARAGDAMRGAIAAGLPTIGICLGMQLFFESSEESTGRGLGIIPGSVERLRTGRVPQMGWNAVENASEPLLAASGLDVAYFANSFVCRPADASVVTAWSQHEDERFPAAVRAGSAVGVQFHPEKSSAPGIRFLRAFIEEVRGR